MFSWAGKDERRPERMATSRSSEVLPHLDSGLRCRAGNDQVFCVHHHPAHCVDQKATENYSLGSLSSHLGFVLGHLSWYSAVLPAGSLSVSVQSYLQDV